MRLIEGIKLTGKPVLIPESSRNDLPQFFADMGYKVGAEIGVYRGEFTKKFCEAGLKMFAIDPWIGYSGAGRTEQKKDMQDYNFECAQKTLSPFPDCTFIRKTSLDAIADFKNKSLDFVYIDGDHRFRYIAEDLSEWFWKVKKGGIVSGHDYFCTHPGANNVICQVKPIIDAFIKTYDIKNFYTFGEKDRTLSWMFIKP